MIILDVISDFSSVESEFCTEEKFGIKLAFVSISYVTLFIKTQKSSQFVL